MIFVHSSGLWLRAHSLRRGPAEFFASSSKSATKALSILVIVFEYAKSVWTRLSAPLRDFRAWLLHRLLKPVTTTPVRIDTGADIRAIETRQRSEFRTMLMSEISGMRQVIKEHEADTESLRHRLNTTLAQALVLRATVEIMEKRVAFLKDRQAIQHQGISFPNRGGVLTQA